MSHTSLRASRLRQHRRDPRCRYCLTTLAFDETTYDHLMPRSKGGRGPGNYLMVCGECNYRKADRTPAELLAWARRVADFARGREIPANLSPEETVETLRHLADLTEWCAQQAVRLVTT